MGIIRGIRAAATCLLVFVGLIVLFPVQLMSWLLFRRAWGKTQPYLALDYFWHLGVSSPDDPVEPYRVWLQKRRG